jgi:tryptophanyl-tRNA synthetase
MLTFSTHTPRALRRAVCVRSKSSNAKGVVTEPRRPRTIFSGIQPTGVPHLGNYLGALREWVKLQDEADSTDQLFFSVVDLHALTVKQERDQFLRYKKETLASLLAVGLDPKRSSIFEQSRVGEHTQLMWLLSCNASMGYLGRMTQWKVILVTERHAGGWYC